MYAHLLPGITCLTTIQNAIVQKYILRTGYENLNGGRSIREMEPIGLTFDSLKRHLIA